MLYHDKVRQDVQRRLVKMASLFGSSIEYVKVKADHPDAKPIRLIGHRVKAAV